MTMKNHTFGVHREPLICIVGVGDKKAEAEVVPAPYVEG
jgi:hypothetical protein